MDTGSLVKHSGVWEMKTKNTTRCYYNSELYCSFERLPRDFRLEKVVAHLFPEAMTFAEQTWK